MLTKKGGELLSIVRFFMLMKGFDPVLVKGRGRWTEIGEEGVEEGWFFFLLVIVVAVHGFCCL